MALVLEGWRVPSALQTGNSDAVKHDDSEDITASNICTVTERLTMAKREQHQFLNVIDRDAAEKAFLDAIDTRPLGAETVSLENVLGRILAYDVIAQVDVPSFDRSNFDGFAVVASDTFGAAEEQPIELTLIDEPIATAVEPKSEVSPGRAIAIATGGMIPRGADAIMMVEDADVSSGEVLVRRAVSPGFGISFAGTDIGCGETVLRAGDLITSREAGVLAAIGATQIKVRQKPRVAVISTGNEIIPPGAVMRPGLVYDSNARILADAVSEAGGLPEILGIVSDDMAELETCLQKALAKADVIVLSGGTSKGEGDLSYHAVQKLTSPGIICHGVALKPGKPICLAAHHKKPVVILPGFPTSAVFTFHEFVAPVIRKLGGLPDERRETVKARMAIKTNSVVGRTEYVLVGLNEIDLDAIPRYSAFPMGKGSGSVTTFSRADGFVTIDRNSEIIEAGTQVNVTLLSRHLRPADLVVMGSHCVGLDFLLGLIHQKGFRTKFLAIGSTAGLEAVKRGECDLAGIHLLDESSGQYNTPYVSEDVRLVRGYTRRQGILFRTDDTRFEQVTRSKFPRPGSRSENSGERGRVREKQIGDLLASESMRATLKTITTDPDCRMINRNQGSGTRILIDKLLDGSQPSGYAVQSCNHQAVATAIAQRRADWGVAIENVAAQQGLGFLPIANENYDFAIAKSRFRRPAVVEFAKLLCEESTTSQLNCLGFQTQS